MNEELRPEVQVAHDQIPADLASSEVKHHGALKTTLGSVLMLAGTKVSETGYSQNKPTLSIAGTAALAIGLRVTIGEGHRSDRRRQALRNVREKLKSIK